MMSDQTVPNHNYSPTPKSASSAQALLNNGILVLGFAGLIGGMIGAVLSEVIQGGQEKARFFNDSLEMSSGAWFALALLGIGAAMSVSQGITERNPEKSTSAALLTIPASLFGGFVAGVIAQTVYGPLAEGGLPNEVPRAIGWAIAGGLGGAAVGAGFRSFVRVRNCALGGLAGGFVGGLVFNTVGQIVDSGFGSRFVGITLIGTLMGLAVGLIDKVTVSAYIEQAMREGAPIRFALFDQSMLLGCASNVGVTVKGDSGIAEHHLRLTKQGKALGFQTVGNVPPIVVNGQQMTNGILNNGDVFVVGNTQLRYVVGASTGLPVHIQQPGHGNAGPQQNWQANQVPQQPVGRQSVSMQPVTPRQQPGTASQQPIQQSPPASSRPIIPIKKPD
jgi:hypothetical protein